MSALETVCRLWNAVLYRCRVFIEARGEQDSTAGGRFVVLKRGIFVAHFEHQYCAFEGAIILILIISASSVFYSHTSLLAQATW
jgi:hypothetical protein